MMQETDVVIVGGGPAGLSAAIWCKRLGLSHLVLEARAATGGQLRFIHSPLFDYPGIQTANGAEFNELLTRHALDLGCPVTLQAETLRVEPHGPHVVYRQDGAEKRIKTKAVVLATGARDRRLRVPGEEEMIARGEVYSASRDRDRFAGKSVAVIGGGDRAFEGALMLAERGATVHLIHRSRSFRGRAEFTEPALAHPRIRLVAPARVTAIDGESRTEAVQLETQDGRTERIAVEALFVRIGVEPSSGLYRGLAELDEHGFVVVDRCGATSVRGLFAVGDVCTPAAYSSISTAAGQAMTAAKRIYEQVQAEALG